MSFPGLYNEVTPVSTERTTVPAAAVLTHVLHLLMNLLMYVRTYCTYYCTYCTRTYYNQLLSSTYYVLTSTYWTAVGIVRARAVGSVGGAVGMYMHQ